MNLLPLLLLSSASCQSQQEGPPAHHLARRQVDLGNVYDWFSSADTQRNFFVTLTSQLVWTSLGLVLGHGVWQAVRGKDKVSSDPDLPSLIDFVLNDEIAAENVGINIGYFVFGNLAYIGLSLLGDPARRRNSDTGLIADKQDQGDPLLDTLDRVFGLNFALTAVLVATINYAAFMAFWAAMSLLPARSQFFQPNHLKADGPRISEHFYF